MFGRILWMIALLGACGGGGGNDSASGPATFPEKYGQETCDFLDRCGALGSSMADCVAGWAGEFEGAEEVCTFDEAQAEDCLDAIRSASCDDDPFEGPICRRAYDCPRTR